MLKFRDTKCASSTVDPPYQRICFQKINDWLTFFYITSVFDQIIAFDEIISFLILIWPSDKDLFIFSRFRIVRFYLSFGLLQKLRLLYL